MTLFYQPAITDGVLHLSDEEARHARVLRLEKGDAIDITDGKGCFYKAEITEASKVYRFAVFEKKEIAPRHFSIHVAIAPTKNADRMEWFVEKAVEIGIQRITFMLCKTSERKTINRERMEKIAISAMKQSNQAWLPELSDITDFKKVVAEKADERFIAFVDEQNPDLLQAKATSGKTYLVLIGPEGDFSKEELALAIDNKFAKVSLGHNRLRTETAGLAACHVLNLVNP